MGHPPRRYFKHSAASLLQTLSGFASTLRLLLTYLMSAQGPVLEVSGGAEEAELAAFEFEGDVLESDEALAGLRVGVVEIVQRGRAGIHASLDGGEILFGNFIFQLGDFV